MPLPRHHLATGLQEIPTPATAVANSPDGPQATYARRINGLGARELIPLADHSEFMMYGNDVMDLTILGLRSM